MQRVCVESGFLCEFSAGRCGDVLCGIAEKAARQGRHAQVGIDAALDKQYVQARLPQGQDHQVNSEQHRRWLPWFVVIGHTLSLIIVDMTVNIPEPLFSDYPEGSDKPIVAMRYEEKAAISLVRFIGLGWRTEP
jgi:hypothetical protein